MKALEVHFHNENLSCKPTANMVMMKAQLRIRTVQIQHRVNSYIIVVHRERDIAALSLAISAIIPIVERQESSRLHLFRLCFFLWLRAACRFTASGSNCFTLLR